MAIRFRHKSEDFAIATEEQEDTTVYLVLVNAEEQYSLWPKYREVPKGWRSVGPEGPKAECLKYIEEVWTDMRPLSLRRRMQEAATAKSGIDAGG